MASRSNRNAVVLAASMYALWTAATWFFEGRIETLLRPDAVADHLVYAFAVNLCPGVAGTVLAALVSAVLFGAYHFAHSPPFDAWSMVALLTVVGLATGAFFFLSRDVPGTAIFHNFLGTFGVSQALAATGSLSALDTLQAPLVATALTTTVVLLAGYWWVRRGHSTRLVYSA